MYFNTIKSKEKKKYFTILLIVLFLIFIIVKYNYRHIRELFSNKKGIQRIDGCVYINLDNRPDRRKEILKEMDKMGIDKQNRHRIAGIYIPKNGHKGCTQAHIIGLGIGEMNNWDTTLILEDDAELKIPPDEFNQKLEELFNYLNEKQIKWDVIMLSTAFSDKKDLDGSDDVKQIKYATLGTAYIVNKHYLNKLKKIFLDGNSKMESTQWGKDDGHEPNTLDQLWTKLQKTDNWYGMKEDCIHQRASWSTSNGRGINPNTKKENDENHENEGFMNMSSNSKNKNIKLAIHTVFLPNENVYFLEEWIKYHIHIGFDTIYLYDNDGSKIGNGNFNDNKKNINRYGINYSKLFSSENHIHQEYQRILNKYSNNINYIKWQPKNKDGDIYYGYVESIQHYKKNYKTQHDWTAFIDIDEFIILPSNNYTNMKDLIEDKEINDGKINKIVINQIKMEDRFCQMDKSIFDINNTITNIDTNGWAPKNICKNIDLHKEQLNKESAMHNITVNNEYIYNSNINELYFNHYNVNKKQIDWMKGYFKKDKFDCSSNKDLERHKLKLHNDNIIKNRKYDNDYYQEMKKELCYQF